MFKHFHTILFSIVILSFSTTDVIGKSDLTDAETAANRARPFVEGQAALERYVLTNDCTNSATIAIRANLAELQEDVRLFHLTSFRSYEIEARERHTMLAFGYADEALKRGCLDEADNVYRGIIIFYTGAAYGGIRDRARLGVEDVRAARMMKNN